MSSTQDIMDLCTCPAMEDSLISLPFAFAQLSKSRGIYGNVLPFTAIIKVSLQLSKQGLYPVPHKHPRRF